MARNRNHTDHIHRVIGDYATAIRRGCAIKLYQALAILVICSPAFAAEHARRVTVDTSSFSSNLSATDNTVQKALDTLDDMVAGLSGINWDEIGGTQSDINVSGFTNDSGYITDTNWDAMPQITTSGVNWDDFDLEQADGYNNTNWDTAYGWGNHSTVGYLTTTDKITEGNTEAEVIDTGSDGHFKVTTEGTERLRVTAGGNVGIGTSSPVTILHIVGKAAFGDSVTTNSLAKSNRALNLISTDAVLGITRISGSIDTASPGIEIKHATSLANAESGTFSKRWDIFLNDQGFNFRDRGSGDLVRMIINSSGNVGIGTTDPSAKLHAIKTTEQLRLGYDTSNYVSTTVGSTGVVTYDAVGSGSAFTFSDDVSVPDEAYGAGWNASTEVPTKNAVYDKIETLSGGHDAVTVTDSSEIDFTLTGQDITASLVAGSIDETKLDASTNASLDLADSALQSVDIDTANEFSGIMTEVTGSGDFVRATSPTLVTPALGTPSSGTLTNATGLPIAGLVASTSTALGVGSLELGHASDTTLSRSAAGVLAVEGVVVPTISSISTLTNKTLTSPVINVTSDATGDIYYRNSGGAFTRLPIGTNGHVLKVDTGLPSWAAASGGSSQWSDGDDDAIYYTSGNVGIGTNDPDTDLHVDGQMILTGPIAIGAGNTTPGSTSALWDSIEGMTNVMTIDETVTVDTGTRFTFGTMTEVNSTTTNNAHVWGQTAFIRSDGDQNFTNELIAMFGECDHISSGTFSNNCIGVDGEAFASGTGDVTGVMRGVQGLAGSYAATTVAWSEGVSGQLVLGEAAIDTTGGVLTNAAALKAKSPWVNGGSQTITNQYGLYIEDVSLGATSNHAIYTNAGAVRFGGDTIIMGTLDLGHATANTLSASGGVLSIEGTAIPTVSSTNTLTNKRINPRVTSETSSATPTINTDNSDIHRITALAADITSMTTNLSGTPTHGQKLIIEITGTAARAITWGASFEASTVALPTTTVTTNMLTVGFIWNSATSKWRVVAIA
jgi:hypothetical protein